MSSLVYTLEGWPASPSSNNVARKFNNDTIVWDTAVAAPPFTGQVSGSVQNVRQAGGWDGQKWYVIGPDGKLYAYNPGSNTWSAALVGGAVIISGTVSQQNWCMASDGRFVYILSSSNDFRRYDPVADTLTALTLPPGTGYGPKMFLSYDGSDALYCYRGSGSDGVFGKLTISSNTWSTLPNQATITADIGAALFTGGLYLGGKLWVFYVSGALLFKPFQYDPGSNTWTAKTTNNNTVNSALWSQHHNVYGEDTDQSIRIWPSNNVDGTRVYNIASDSWSVGSVAPWATSGLQGQNFAITRSFNAVFVWYQSDGVTLANPIVDLGSVGIGGTLSIQLKVKTPVALAAGATVSVVVQVGSDAEDPATISATALGSYSVSFSTGALSANQVFDVFIKLSPTAAQALGLGKLFFLRAVAN